MRNDGGGHRRVVPGGCRSYSDRICQPIRITVVALAGSPVAFGKHPRRRAAGLSRRTAITPRAKLFRPSARLCGNPLFVSTKSWS